MTFSWWVAFCCGLGSVFLAGCFQRQRGSIVQPFSCAILFFGIYSALTDNYSVTDLSGAVSVVLVIEMIFGWLGNNTKFVS